MRFFNQMFAILLLLASVASVQGEVSLGGFQETMHGVEGEVVVLSEHVLEVRNFAYSGQAPDAFFWADASPNATADGMILLQASNDCSNDILEFANGTTITLEFPANMTILDIQGGSIAVWCRTMKVNMGQVDVPGEGLEAASSLLAVEQSLVCSDLPEPTVWETIVDQARTYWNVLRWLPSQIQARLFSE